MSVQRIKGKDGLTIESETFLELPKAPSKITSEIKRSGMIRYNKEWKSFEGTLEFADGSISYRRFANLDQNGKLLDSQLPDSVTSGMQYVGTYSPGTDDIDPPIVVGQYDKLPAPDNNNKGHYFIVRGIFDAAMKHLIANNPATSPVTFLFTNPSGQGNWLEIKYYFDFDPLTQGATNIVTAAFGRIIVGNIPGTGHDGLSSLSTDADLTVFSSTNEIISETALTDGDWVISTGTKQQRLRQSRTSILAGAVTFDRTMLYDSRRLQSDLSSGTVQTVLDSLLINGLRRSGDAMYDNGDIGAGRFAVTYGTVSAPSISFNSNPYDPINNPGIDPSKWSDTSTGIFHPANNSIGFTTNGVERFRVAPQVTTFYQYNSTSASMSPTIQFVGNGNTNNLGLTALNNTFYFTTNNKVQVEFTNNLSKFHGDVTIDNTLGVTGKITGSADLQINNNASIGGTLSVTGATTLGNTLNVTGILTAQSNIVGQGTLNITGATTLQNTLSVTGNSTLLGTLTVSGKITANTTFQSLGAATLSSTLSVAGTSTMAAVNATNLTTSGTITSTGLITANGGLTISGGTGLNLTGNASVSGTLTVTGLTSANGGLNVSGGTGLAVTGNSTVSGTETVTGLLSANGGLNVSGGSGLVVTGTISATGTITSAGKLTASTTFQSGGAATFSSTASFAGAVTATGGLDVSGGTGLRATGTTPTALGGTLSVTGATTTAAITASGVVAANAGITTTTIGASGLITANGGVTIPAGGFSVTGNAIVSGTITSTGKLIGNGGSDITGGTGLRVTGTSPTSLGGTLSVTGATTAAAISASGLITATGGINIPQASTLVLDHATAPATLSMSSGGVLSLTQSTAVAEFDFVLNSTTIKITPVGIKLPTFGAPNNTVGEDGMIAYSTTLNAAVQKTGGVWTTMFGTKAIEKTFVVGDWVTSGSDVTITTTIPTGTNVLGITVFSGTAPTFTLVTNTTTVTTTATTVVVRIGTSDTKFAGKVSIIVS